MTDHQVAQALGDLQGTVRGMAEQWHRQEEAATNGRRALYERFEALSNQMGLISGQVTGLTADIAEIKRDVENQIMPTIDNVKARAAHRDGMLLAGRLFWGLVAALAAAAGFAIHEMLLYFGHLPLSHP